MREIIREKISDAVNAGLPQLTRRDVRLKAVLNAIWSHPHTATAIAQDLGIDSDDEVAITGVELDKLSDDDPIDPDVMKRQPRPPSERLTNHSFLRTMVLTGFLTAGVAFAAYFYSLRTETVEMARTHAFAVLVFAELLRSFGARSETKPVWRISLFTNLNLLLVVCASYGLQIWSHHNDILGRFLKTVPIPLAEGLLLVALGTVPLLVLELVKV